ncbi:MAG: ion transporter [Muribaculaceae bacterium]|nr:ion transporter [Muribaculaceae bacterium]
MNIKYLSSNICRSELFEIGITIIIILNSILIGVQTSVHNVYIDVIQHIILWIFTFEIIVRFISSNNIREFFNDGWNVFDLSLVVIGWIPPSIASNASAITMIRILRTFRILRLLRANTEIKLIVTVLAKSVKSMVYNCLLFLIFAYLYAVVGVTLFQLPTQGGNIESLSMVAPPTPSNSPDPFGNISEGIFTLFRVLTAEDWTDLRYNLITASNLGVIDVLPTVITCYFVSWFCLAVFLLLNLVTGAVINNYQTAMAELAECKDNSNERKEIIELKNLSN